MTTQTTERPSLATNADKRAFSMRWVEALRSGGYKQGREWMRQGTTSSNCRYCCLGVCADLYNPGGWSNFLYGRNQSRWKWEGSTGMPFSLRFFFQPIETWIEKNNVDGNKGIGLVELNDNSKESFNDIAALIEQAANEIWPEEAA